MLDAVVADGAGSVAVAEAAGPPASVGSLRLQPAVAINSDMAMASAAARGGIPYVDNVFIAALLAHAPRGTAR
jgi:hypothetical protein